MIVVSARSDRCAIRVFNYSTEDCSDQLVFASRVFNHVVFDLQLKQPKIRIAQSSFRSSIFSSAG